MKIAIIYHGNCYDGITAAWVAWKKLREQNPVLIPGFYGEKPPSFKEKTLIYILDFSYSEEVIQSYLEQGHAIVLLDHHASAAKSLENLTKTSGYHRNLQISFDMNRSGAGMAWNYFRDEEVPYPEVVKLVEDRDLWKFQYGTRSRELYAYMQLYVDFSESPENQIITVDLINKQMIEDEKTVLEKGAVLSELHQKHCRNFALNQIRVAIPKWEPITVVPIITTNKSFGSDTCAYICKEFHVGAAGYFFLEKAYTWNWGFRSVGNADVSKLCELYGGGGHKNAAGFIHRGPNPFPADWDIFT